MTSPLARSQWLIDAEHVFAERAAVAVVAYGFRADNEFAAGAEEAEIFSISLVGIEKETVVRIVSRHNGIIFNMFIDEAMEANIVMHQIPSVPKDCVILA